MHDIRFIRKNPEEFDELLGRRKFPASAEELIVLDEKRRSAQTEMQNLQQLRNNISKKMICFNKE